MNQKIAQKIKKAPLAPGVYFFRNKDSETIYIGRAANLKNRLKNYLAPTDPKTKKMTEEAVSVEWKTTKNLLEAIVLEANLIKKCQPFFNIKEKDNRSFVYIIIPQTKWPYPRIVRGRELAKFQPHNTFIFGPLQSYSLAKNFLHSLRKVFPYSTCAFNSGRPCFHYQIGLCLGKCVNKISETDYNKIIQAMINFLQGKIKKAKIFLKKNYPEKLKLFDQMEDAYLITNEEFRLSPQLKIEGYDISHFGGKETVGAMVVFQNQDIDPSQYRLFKIRNAPKNDDLLALAEMFERRLNHPEWPYPNLILVDGGREQVKIFEKVLAQRKISIPVVGISKFQNDKLIFGKMKKSVKDLVELSKNDLLKLRDEAHRFANNYRKKLMSVK
ncbi:MAG TPA: GIY-YIG nuclease family protein [Candidatus Paceibacterota bacterium]|nr:GIY-YIG nuclease family protein [Candidatus Paceibacterota bacterium]HQM34857.1 GIY-YIG nuclease family protein [Candidatus Paceibacterota bacterium]